MSTALIDIEIYNRPGGELDNQRSFNLRDGSTTGRELYKRTMDAGALFKSGAIDK